jgi:uncharacterized membrane protein
MSRTPSTASRSGSLKVEDPGPRERLRGTLAGVRRNDPVAQALGWFSLGVGVPQLVAPGGVARAIGAGDGSGRRIAMRVVGVREIVAGAGILTRPQPARWLWARVAGDVKDLVLLALALRAKKASKGRIAVSMGAVAGLLIPDLLESIRLTGSSGALAAERAVRQAVTVNRPPDEVYAFWRDFENLPRFMTHVESVRVTGPDTSHWTAKAPLGGTVEWDARIVDDRPNEVIAWSSLENADVENSGTVRFNEAPGGRGTEVLVEISYAAPAGTVGATIAKLFGEEPEAQTYDDLRRFKQVIETGEVVRSEGTPGGISLLQQLRQRTAQAAGRDRDSATV